MGDKRAAIRESRIVPDAMWITYILQLIAIITETERANDWFQLERPIASTTDNDVSRAVFIAYTMTRVNVNLSKLSIDIHLNERIILINTLLISRSDNLIRFRIITIQNVNVVGIGFVVDNSAADEKTNGFVFKSSFH